MKSIKSDFNTSNDKNCDGTAGTFNLKAVKSRNDVLRKLFERQKTFGGVRAEHVTVDGYEGRPLPMLILSPEDEENELPCLLYLHGGGFVAAPSTVHYYYGREYAKRAHCRVIIPDYVMAYDAPFPAPLEDTIAAYRYAMTLSDKIAVAGDSSGGCLAASCALMCRERGLPLPCLQMLLYPVLDRRMETQSMTDLADAFPWNRQANEEMWRIYLEGYEGDKRAASPAEAEDLSGLSPAYIEAGECDCLRDEALIYGERLLSAGVKAEIHTVEGASHGFDNDIRTPLALKYTDLRIACLKSFLG